MNKLPAVALALVFFLPVTQSQAAAVPQNSRFDKRMQQVNYNPQNVTVIDTKAGFLTTLVFNDEEAVISARAGFEEGWEIKTDANRVYLRPVALAQGAPGEDGNTTQVVILPNKTDWHTNLFVVTTKRFYNLELNVIDDKSEAQPAFQITYRYPAEVKSRAQQADAAQQQQSDEERERRRIRLALEKSQTPRNWDYWKTQMPDSGNITPDFVYDDGRFTFIGFSPQKNIPSVFRYQGGKESVVNRSVEKKGNYTILVIHQIAQRLVLRSGKAAVGLENRAYGQVKINDNSTVSPQVIRAEN